MLRPSLVRTSLLCAALALATTGALRAQQPQGQQPAAPTGPLAPEKYKDIQVLKDVPADQLDLTMRYFVAATGLNCSNCHQRDQATGEFNYPADTNTICGENPSSAGIQKRSTASRKPRPSVMAGSGTLMMCSLPESAPQCG